MARIDVTTSDDLEARFREHCEHLGMRKGELAREIFERYMRENFNDLNPKSKSVVTRKTEEKSRHAVWLTKSETAGLERRAELMGRTKAGWLISCIRHILTREPQPSDDEIEALRQSNYILLSVARDLNLIARMLSKGQNPTDKMDSVRDVVKEIRKHCDSVDRMIRASVERWEIR